MLTRGNTVNVSASMQDGNVNKISANTDYLFVKKKPDGKRVPLGLAQRPAPVQAFDFYPVQLSKANFSRAVQKSGNAMKDTLTYFNTQVMDKEKESFLFNQLKQRRHPLKPNTTTMMAIINKDPAFSTARALVGNVGSADEWQLSPGTAFFVFDVRDGAALQTYLAHQNTDAFNHDITLQLTSDIYEVVRQEPIIKKMSVDLRQKLETYVNFVT